ncbi:hypothetical protein H671_xg20568 [Cricetulus griseus]|uniref:Uncharacterized protein n=1 Tax=Cricetulus griseus TaxID=10029 RepID=A0A061HWX8_CRIGR|nr:hypothetical protein H671_xg20568 [Cricetulus griseus]
MVAAVGSSSWYRTVAATVIPNQNVAATVIPKRFRGHYTEAVHALELELPAVVNCHGIVAAVYADWHTNQLAFCFLLEQTLVSLVRESPGLVETDWGKGSIT